MSWPHEGYTTSWCPGCTNRTPTCQRWSSSFTFRVSCKSSPKLMNPWHQNFSLTWKPSLLTVLCLHSTLLNLKSASITSLNPSFTCLILRAIEAVQKPMKTRPYGLTDERAERKLNIPASGKLYVQLLWDLQHFYMHVLSTGLFNKRQMFVHRNVKKKVFTKFCGSH